MVSPASKGCSHAYPGRLVRLSLGRGDRPESEWSWALGADAPDAGVMNAPPRPKGEGVTTPPPWGGILFGGAVMAAGSLFVLDAALPGGLVEGRGDLRYAQTMAFTTLVLFQLFNVFNTRSDERSAFAGLFENRWLWAAVAVSITLHGAVIYVPFLQQAFSTVASSLADWLRWAAVASSVLWLGELAKGAARTIRRHRPSRPDSAVRRAACRSPREVVHGRFGVRGS